MGKSIRSKVKRRFRAIKRANLEEVEKKQIEERNAQLKIHIGQLPSSDKAPEDAAEGVAKASTNAEDANFEFGKPARVNFSKLKKIKRQRKKLGVPARLRQFL